MVEEVKREGNMSNQDMLNKVKSTMATVNKMPSYLGKIGNQIPEKEMQNIRSFLTDNSGGSEDFEEDDELEEYEKSVIYSQEVKT